MIPQDDPRRPVNLCPIKSPCKDCRDRFVGCHSKCEKYLEFRKKRDEQLEEINKRKKFQVDLDTYIADSVAKSKKGRLHRSLITENRRHWK